MQKYITSSGKDLYSRYPRGVYELQLSPRCHPDVTQMSDHPDVTQMSPICQITQMSPRCHPYVRSPRCHPDVTQMSDHPDVTQMSDHPDVTQMSNHLGELKCKSETNRTVIFHSQLNNAQNNVSKLKVCF